MTSKTSDLDTWSEKHHFLEFIRMSKQDWVRFWGAGLIFGTSFFWIKIALAEISPFMLVGLRTFIGAVGLLTYILLNHSFHFNWKTTPRWLGIFIVIGLLNIALPWLMITWAEQTTPSAIAAIVNSTTPMFTALLAIFLLQEDKLNAAKLAGLLIGFGGVVVLYIPSLRQGSIQNLLALAAMLLAAFMYGIAGIYIKRKAGDQLPSEIQAFLQMALASIMVWTFNLATGQPLHFPHLTITWVALLWLGLLGSNIAYIFSFALLHSVGPTRSSMFTYVPPLVGLILGAVFLGEQIGWQTLVGGAMIILGIAIVNLKQFPSFKPVIKDP